MMVRKQMEYIQHEKNATPITSLGQNEVLRLVAVAISEEILQCNAAGIYLRQEDGTYKRMAGYGVMFETMIFDPEEDLMIQRIMNTKQTLYIPDTSIDHRLVSDYVEAFNIKSLLASPIFFEDELFGLIFLFNDRTPMYLSEPEIQRVEVYAHMVSVAIRNAGIFKHRELIAEERLMQGVLRDLCMSTSSEDSLHTCFFYLEKILHTWQLAAYLLDPCDQHTITLIKTWGDKLELGQSLQTLIQDVVKTSQILFIEDVREDERLKGQCHMKSILLIPFASMGQVAGVIAAFNVYPDFQIPLAQSIVDATALTLSNVQYVDRLENMVEERTKELAAANEKVTSIIDGMTDGFFTLDQEWKFTYINKHQFLPQNKTVTEVLGKSIWGIFPKAVGTAMYKEFHRAMREDIPVHFEMRSVYEDVWHEIVAYPYDDGICCLFKNITEKKKYEKELRRLSSLDLIGQMAAGISHEIRNPMTTVRGFLQLLKMENKFIHYKRYLDLMIEELDRANTIITEFLSIGNTRTSELQMLDLNTIVHDIVPLIKIDAASQSQMIAVETGDIPQLLLNRNEIRQLLMNLYRNGFEAMGEGQVLTIKTYKEGNHVILAVQDQGAGISPEVMEKLGTPFFTTKDNGTGLGLGVCYAIAARHNATIDIETGAEGTTFFVKFQAN